MVIYDPTDVSEKPPSATLRPSCRSLHDIHYLREVFVNRVE